jgi:peptidoglycan/LPS O-acetylase OafA/YrhL
VPEVDTPAIPAPAKLRHYASLDSLRALAVLAVIAYHYDLSWARGGFLGVDLFFVLSGFLITTLLILEWRRSDRIALGVFWGRRARRLLPALLVVLVVVAIVTVHTVDPWKRAGVRDDGVASLFYAANWRFIAAKQGYFELFAAPSPLRHMWSLAIEEQFYLVWPLITFALLRAARGSLRLLGAVCIAGIAASIAAMAFLYDKGDPSRAYYGTDTRAHTILMGALLAIVLAVWNPGAVARRYIRTTALMAFIAIMIAWNATTGTSARYYHGGSAVYAALTCIVIAGALQPGVLQRALSLRPLAWIGRISYGLYLFHWPLDVWLVPTRVHLHGTPLNLLRLAVTFAVATISYYLVELPIRERRRPALPWRDHDRHRHPPRRNVARWLAIPALAVTLAVVLTTTTGAAPAPSYLVGARRPPRISSPPILSVRRSTPTTPGESAAGPSPTTSIPPPPKFTPIHPTAYPWSFGDPLYCDTPRATDTREAVDEARKLAPLDVTPGSGLRILLVGDSTACSFYPGLKAEGDRYGVYVAQAAVFGCGVASGQITTTRNEQITPHSERCQDMVNEAVDPAIYEVRPQVVVWMSIWEKSDLVVDGKTLVSGTPAGDAEIQRRMDWELARLTAYGAKVVLLSEAAAAPDDAQGVGNTSNAVDDAGYARLDRILRQFASRHVGQVTLIDLADHVCPGGPPCSEYVDGLRLRPDGRHFTPTAASIEAHWLLPKILATTPNG